jgi:hypothetical protein
VTALKQIGQTINATSVLANFAQQILPSLKNTCLPPLPPFLWKLGKIVRYFAHNMSMKQEIRFLLHRPCGQLMAQWYSFWKVQQTSRKLHYSKRQRRARNRVAST